ncbi:DUF721 domain-containing protein [Limibacter armeniacum]|uniref:DUF721 domain-containing protein n=1 Tax=Limibacter armeniacum TaxID=466084 RepID=UPI002FE5AD1B
MESNKIKYRFRKYNFTPKKHEPTSVKDVMNDIVKSFKMEARYNNAVIMSSWEKIMGRTIASRTEKVFVKKKILYIKINSAPLKNELTMSRNKIVEMINKYLGNEAVTDVRFI